MKFLEKVVFIWMLTVLVPGSLIAMEPEWEFLQEKNSIRIYRRDVPGTEIDEFKGETIIPVGIEVIGMLS